MTARQPFIRLGIAPLRARNRRVTRSICAALLLLAVSSRTWAAQIPVVTAASATQVSSTAALVTGTVNPNGVPAAYCLQWGLTTAYGSATYFYPIAAVSTPTNVTAWMTNLTPSTTYHYRLLATNSAGSGYSGDMTVTTTAGPDPGSAPTVIAYAATEITSSSASISGMVNPNGLSCGCWALWGTNTAYDHFRPMGYALTGSSPIVVSNSLLGLTPNTTYHYQLVATNSAGQTTSSDLSFTTSDNPAPAQIPAVVADAATQVSSTAALVTGTVNPNGVPAAYCLQWGLSTAYGSATYFQPIAAVSTATNVAAWMTGLNPSTTYHYRLLATNSAGSGYSGDMTVTTTADSGAGAPVVTVNPATDITSTSAAVTGTVDSKGQPAGCFVQWGTTVAYGFASPAIPVPLADTAVAVSNSMILLSPNTTYHYRLVATNSNGTGYSADMVMTTAASPAGQPPTVTMQAATSITTTGAGLWGTLGSGGLFTTYYFRWGLDTNYGNTLTPGWIASNDYQISVYTVLSGLSPGTTYHFQIVATNTAGTTWGDDQAFTTQGFATNNADVYTYLITNGTITITAYTGPGGQVTIPGTLLGLPVTAIGDGAFANIPTLTSVDIPDSITDLGASAFAEDTGLTNVTLPNTLTSINDNAFNRSGLISVVIPDSVTNIGASAFASCSQLASIQLGNGVRTIEGLAFYFCPSLTSVTIPDSVTALQGYVLSWGGPISAFAYCSGLTNVIIGKGLTYLAPGSFAFCPNLLSVLFQGNAPDAPTVYDIGAFRFADAATIYYLPGTTGWGNTFAGLPAVMWNPQPQPSIATVGTRQNGFAFNVTGPADTPVVVEASTNFATGPWVPVQTCTLTNGVLHFADCYSTNYPMRFYRVRAQ